MKKILLICLCLAMLCLSTAIGEETLESWNAGSDWRITAEAAVWNLPTDEAKGIAPVITLPRNTYVRVLVQDDGWSVIDYFAGGSVRTGAVHDDVLQLLNGSTPVPTAKVTPVPVATAIPSEANPTPIPQELPAGLTLVTATPVATIAPERAANAPTVSFILNGEARTGTLQQLGSAESLLWYGDDLIRVDSALLTFSAAVPADKQVAAINAAKSGKASLRASASARAEALLQLTDGELVCILAQEGDFWLAWCEGTVGYLADSVVEFGVLQQALGTGTLCTAKGRTSGGSLVNVRAAAKKNGLKLYEWPVGTRVTILKKVSSDWYLIEAEGRRGYVQASLVKAD